MDEGAVDFKRLIGAHRALLVADHVEDPRIAPQILQALRRRQVHHQPDDRVVISVDEIGVSGSPDGCVALPADAFGDGDVSDVGPQIGEHHVLIKPRLFQRLAHRRNRPVPEIAARPIHAAGRRALVEGILAEIAEGFPRHGAVASSACCLA